ncbi:MAG: sulfite exporter TauE/SafE family protein [Rhodobacterales bacterium]|nr:sulfite exporter TauE/SafE family protein [Rhodobacterales bacterium]
MLADALPLILSMLVAGAFAGLLAGLFGIGGGFVVVPALAAVFTILSTADHPISDDKIMHVAIGTSLATIIFTSLRSVQAHAKRGAVDFNILKQWAPWVVLGVILGLSVARFLDGKSLKLIFGVGVFIMAWHFLFPILSKRTVSNEMPKGVARGGLGSFLGGFCTLLGIGGGTPAILIMTLSGQPVHRAIATAAGFGTIIAVPGTIGSIISGLGEPGLPFGSIGYVNVIAMLAIISMSMITAPIGAALTHSLDSAKLKKALGIYLLCTSSLMLWTAFHHAPAKNPLVTASSAVQTATELPHKGGR